jgi:tRNA C32,U32 (ribose-2'-O)-methylase TrmJ
MKIALFETITPGNIGAVARVMKNFGYKELLLINPKCNHLSEDAFQRACHAKDILESARVISEQELFKKFVVGTTSKAFTRRPRRQAVTPNKNSFLPDKATLKELKKLL